MNCATAISNLKRARACLAHEHEDHVEAGWCRDAENLITLLRAKLVNLHHQKCTFDNCVLDGGEEHQIAFPEEAIAAKEKSHD